jgi:DNA replication protein DnaC
VPDVKVSSCPNHGTYKATLTRYNSETGRAIYSRCPECEKQRERDGQWEANTARVKQKKRIFAQCGIGKRFIRASFEGYHAKSKPAAEALHITSTYCKMFKEIAPSGSSLILCGRPGTGKTHLACAIGVTLLNQLISVKYTTTYKAMLEIKSTFGRKEGLTEDDVIKSFIAPALLIIDEVGVQYDTKAENVLFYQLINGRYDNLLPTILISNLNENELTKMVGERCIDRMCEADGAIVPFTWNSYRR